MTLFFAVRMCVDAGGAWHLLNNLTGSHECMQPFQNMCLHIRAHTTGDS